MMIMDLDSLKYSELQKLAKDVGIKANVKSDRLKKALEDYYTSHNETDNKLTRGKGQSRNISDQPTSNKSHKHKRRGTYDVDDEDAEVSIGATLKGDTGRGKRQSTHDIINNMDTAESDDVMKESLMDAINKKVEKRLLTDGKTTLLTKIPRFTKKDHVSTTPGNKNWKSIHKREFDKMDSIDVYMEKKKKRTEALAHNVSINDTMTKAHAAIEKHKNYRTPDILRNPMQRSKIMAKSKLFPTPASDVPFKPTVLYTKDININFSALKSPVFKSTAASKIAKPVVVPKRKSPRSGLRGNATAIVVSKKLSIMTPGKGAEPKSTKKPAFNLQESLTRRLTWVPYTGKVKPLETKRARKRESCDAPTSRQHKLLSRKSLVKQDRKNVKTPMLKMTKESRRKEEAAARADKQFTERMKRRGLPA